MRYSKIIPVDSANGDGVRTSLFLQGCSRHCKGCFNQDTWNPDGGHKYMLRDEITLFEQLQKDWIDGLSVLGGEPLEQAEELTELLKRIKEVFPNKSIWLWTGFRFEDVQNNPVFEYVDVVVDGEFMEDKKVAPGTTFYGSSNQRVINVKEWKSEN